MSRPTDWYVLPLDGDPTPGDPTKIREMSRGLADLGDDAADAERDVRGIGGDSAVLTWIGAAGDAFRPAIGKLPGQLGKLKTSYHLAADALGAYATALENAQAQADRALAQGRAAHADLLSAQAQLSSAQGALSAAARAAVAAQATTPGAPPPDPTQVSTAVRNQAAAQSSVSTWTARVDDAQSRLDVARRLAQQAGDVRKGAAHTAAGKLHDAANAGIPPDSFWHKLGDLASAAWSGLVAVAKVVVAIGSIVALIVGGPIAWIVVGAAVIVLLDTLNKYREGKASLLDVGLAMLNCIPMTKGLTTFAALKAAFKDGGLLSVGAHLLSAGKTAVASGVKSLPVLWKGRRAIPSLLRAAPYNVVGRLTEMSAKVRMQATSTWTAFGMGVGDGKGVFGVARSGLMGALHGWRDGAEAFEGQVAAGDFPSVMASRWQGRSTYPGKDLWYDETKAAGTKLEVLYPHISGFTAPEGSFAALDNDASRISEGLQVGPSDLDLDNSDIGRRILHNYRPEALTLRLNTDVRVATSTVQANAQYGAGGLTQHFVPNLADRIDTKAITIVDANGAELNAAVDAAGHINVQLGNGSVIKLHNFDLAQGSVRSTSNTVAGVLDGAHFLHQTYVVGYAADLGVHTA